MDNVFSYQNEKTREISFPLGGIGTGSIGLGGNGGLLDWEIFNRPNKGSRNGMSHFAVKAVKDGSLLSAKVLNGDLKKDLVGQYSKVNFSGYGYGPGVDTMAGFPHFSGQTFAGEFPTAKLTFHDEGFPGEITLTAFNPFIPLDDKASGIPAAFFEIEIENTNDFAIQYTAALSVKNCFSEESRNCFIRREKLSMIKLYQDKLCPEDIGFGDITIATDSDSIQYQESWFRGEWFDGATVFWNDFCSGGSLVNRTYDRSGKGDMATLAAEFTAQAHQIRKVRFVISWNFPNQYNYWNPYKKQTDRGEKDITWKNYYATLFSSSSETACYCLNHWDDLYEKTLRFRDAMFSSTLPKEVIEAVSANLAVLKSPTVLRLEDGSFYGWEGVHEQEGSCEGSCSHVWNYAYALPFLFPALERSMRDLDFRFNQWENGRMSFRLQLPVGRKPDGFHPCLDGQMGAVIKTYRDWKLCGDDDWLRKNWPAVKKALAFAWHEENDYNWDKNKDGVLEGRQHHTLDMELYGPSSWLQSFYLAALKAGAEMADYLGETETAEEYRLIFSSGKSWCESHLFNGEYFNQEIDLKNREILKPYEGAHERYWNEEAQEIKYQIGHGCEIDQVCGQWHANICGLGEIFEKAKVQSSLQSIYRYNFKRVMRRFFNPCRIFCLNEESGTVICEYPEGTEKPTVPIPYCQECMTGFEYQAAALMISEGMTEQGLELVRAIRSRYDGEKRNPWNEIECGSNYARSMASYSLIPIFSGFIFDLPKGLIGFDPIQKSETFRCLWSVDSGWGLVEIVPHQTQIRLLGGHIRICQLKLPYLGDKAVSVKADGAELAAACRNGLISMPYTDAKQSVTVTY